jgi:ABC-type transport system involved in multi-copper enzyme maturation permease subunit
MSSTHWKIVLIGLAFLLAFALGYTLSRVGKPYPLFVFTVHKLITLGIIVYLGMTIFKLNQIAPLSSIHIAIIIITGLCFVATMATGAMLSVDKTVPEVVHKLHQITPYLTMLSTSAVLYLLLSKTAGLSGL